MRIKYFTGFIISLFICCACQQRKELNPAKKSDATASFSVKLPDIPVMITQPEQRADFLARHYWDNTLLSSSIITKHSKELEQAWSNYIDILKYIPFSTAKEVLNNFIEKTNEETKVFTFFTKLAEKYLYDPNSPMRNEELYIPVLETMMASHNIDSIQKQRINFKLQLALKNRPGSKAIDFTYTLASGKQARLYNIRADYTLLFINNPGCKTCSEYTEGIMNSTIINDLINSGKLKIFAFYTDEDIKEWYGHRQDFPSEWINGYDKKQIILKNNLYDLKAIPTLYLMDKNKVIILKDATLQVIEKWLTDHTRY